MNGYERRGHVDTIRWRCMNKYCRGYKHSFSIRHGSFFDSFHISIVDVWTVVVCWLESVPAKNIVNIFGISNDTVTRIFQMLRTLISDNLHENPISLGGHGMVCEIDESLISYRPKYNRGHAPDRQIWCFGIVDTSFTPAKGYITMVQNRRRDTLFPIISRVCRPGSIIHSDEWAAYATIQRDLGFSHLTVNHSVNFVNPATGCHTQHIESYWNRVKSWIKTMKGVRNDGLQLYLAEFMWKDNHRERSLVVLMGLLQVQS